MNKHKIERLKQRIEDLKGRAYLRSRHGRREVIATMREMDRLTAPPGDDGWPGICGEYAGTVDL